VEITLVRPHALISAAEAIGKIGPVAVPFLAEALRGLDSNVRWHAADAFEEIGPAAADGRAPP